MWGVISEENTLTRPTKVLQLAKSRKINNTSTHGDEV